MMSSVRRSVALATILLLGAATATAQESPPAPPTPAPAPRPKPVPAPRPSPTPPVPAPPPRPVPPVPSPPNTPLPAPPPAQPPSPPPPPTPVPPPPPAPIPRPTGTDGAAAPLQAGPAPLGPAPAPTQPGSPDPASPAAPAVPIVAPPSDAVAAPPSPASPSLSPVSVPVEDAAAVPPPGSPAAEPAMVDVTVVGTRLARTAGSAHVITQKQLERFEQDDVTAVLQSTPGLYVRTEDGMGLRPNIGLRGVNPDRSKKVTLLEDGVLFGPAPYSAPAAYYFPLITRMTKVSVIKGPAAISHGPQTVGGAVDLTTRPIPAQLAAMADVAAGQYGYGKAHVYAGNSTDRFGVLIEGVRLQNNGFKELLDGADTGFVRNEWMVKSSFVVDPRAAVRNEFKLKLTYSDEVSNETYLGLADVDFRADPNQRYPVSQLDRMKNHRLAGVLTHVLEASPNLTLTTNLYRHKYDRSWRKVNGIRGERSLFDVLSRPTAADEATLEALRGNGSSTQTIMIGPNDRQFTSQGVDSRLRWNGQTGRLGHRVEAGVRYHFDSIFRRHSQEGFNPVGDQLIPTSQRAEVTAHNYEYTHAVALHAADAITLGELTLTPGIRAELYRMVSDDRLTSREQKDFDYAILPGIGAYYGLYRGLGVLAGVYQGFSPQPPGSEKGIDPEKSVNYEAGARYTRGASRLESIFFFNDYRNLTDYCSESNCAIADKMDEQVDAGKARIFGVEALLEHDFPVRAVKLPVAVAYTFTRAEFLNDVPAGQSTVGEIRRGDDVHYVPKHQLRAQAGVEHPRFGVFLAATYVSKMLEEPGNLDAQKKGLTGSEQRLTTDEQLIFDLTGQAKVWGPLSVYANIMNLFDQQYIVARRPFGARPNAPRWAHVGLKATF